MPKNYAQSGPQYIAQYGLDEQIWTVFVTRDATFSGGTIVRLTDDQYKRFNRWLASDESVHIEESLSDLPLAARETLRTGMKATDFIRS